MAVIRPEPTGREIKLDPNEIIMSKTDKKGIIEYANDYFMQICGYEEHELMGEPHNCIRHPLMPKIVFKILWHRLHTKKNIHAIVINLAKNGSHYWVITDFDFKLDEDGEIRAIYSRRRAATQKSIDFFGPLYKKLCEIEEKRGMDGSWKYLLGYLEEEQITLDDLVLKLNGGFDGKSKEVKKTLAEKLKENEKVEDVKELMDKAVEKKGFFKRLFGG